MKYLRKLGASELSEGCRLISRGATEHGGPEHCELTLDQKSNRGKWIKFIDILMSELDKLCMEKSKVEKTKTKTKTCWPVFAIS